MSQLTATVPSNEPTMTTHVETIEGQVNRLTVALKNIEGATIGSMGDATEEPDKPCTIRDRLSRVAQELGVACSVADRIYAGT